MTTARPLLAACSLPPPDSSLAPQTHGRLVRAICPRQVRDSGERVVREGGHSRSGVRRLHRNHRHGGAVRCRACALVRIARHSHLAPLPPVSPPCRRRTSNLDCRKDVTPSIAVACYRCYHSKRALSPPPFRVPRPGMAALWCYATATVPVDLALVSSCPFFCTRS